ncbi:MAG: hypothetical protein AAFN27_13270 [Pseudomonadota bacterium]
MKVVLTVRSQHRPRARKLKREKPPWMRFVACSLSNGQSLQLSLKSHIEIQIESLRRLLTQPRFIARRWHRILKGIENGP